jgi:hypothetical protein
MRYLSVDGQWLTAFPRFLVAVCSLDGNPDVLRDLPAAYPRRDVAGKMDDLLAAKLYPGPGLIQIGEHSRSAIALRIIFPSAIMTLHDSEQDLKSCTETFAYVRQPTGSMCLWFEPIRPCTGILSQADRILAASYGFCTGSSWLRCANSSLWSSNPCNERAKGATSCDGR